MLTSLRAPRTGTRLFHQARRSNYYMPTLTDTRPEEGGRGGRASNADVKVAVFGASGFLGGHVATLLGANGFTGYLANRGDDLEMREIKTQFDLGRSRFVFYSPRDRESIKEVIADADIVVNMIGKYYESGQPYQTKGFPYLGYKTNYSFEDANVLIPQTLAEICKEMQVDHFIHVSSASANPDSKSRWSRTKWEGEQAVKEIYPWATIVRPTQLFGARDFWITWFAKVQNWFRCRPVLYHPDGKEPLVMPVWVGDVAKTIFFCCDNPKLFEGREIDCFGPADFTYPELAEFVNDITEQNTPMRHIPLEYARQFAKASQWVRDPLVIPDLVEIWNEDFVPRMSPEDYRAQTNPATKIFTLEDFGIKPRRLEEEAFGYLHMYRWGGHFHRVDGYHLEER